MMTRELDVLVIGGGQAGLAMGYHLKRAGLGSIPGTAAAASKAIGVSILLLRRTR